MAHYIGGSNKDKRPQMLVTSATGREQTDAALFHLQPLALQSRSIKEIMMTSSLQLSLSERSTAHALA